MIVFFSLSLLYGKAREKKRTPGNSLEIRALDAQSKRDSMVQSDVLA